METATVTPPIVKFEIKSPSIQPCTAEFYRYTVQLTHESGAKALGDFWFTKADIIPCPSFLRVGRAAWRQYQWIDYTAALLLPGWEVPSYHGGDWFVENLSEDTPF